MQYPTILLAFLAASVTASQIEERQTTLERRVDLEQVLQWCQWGGSALDRIEQMSTIINNLITSVNTASSCETVTVTVTVTKRSLPTHTVDGTTYLNVTNVDDFDFEKFRTEITSNATNTDGMWLYYMDDQKLQHDGMIQYDDGYLRNLNVTSDYVEALVGTYSNSTLEARTTFLSTELYVKYHASDKCQTVAATSTLKAGVTLAVTRMSDGTYSGACFMFSYGGTWRGHLKMMDLSASSGVPYWSREQLCRSDTTTAATSCHSYAGYVETV